MTDPTPSYRFRDRISVPLLRILRVYVALATTLVMGLTLSAAFYYQDSSLEYQNQRILTRLVAEITSQAGELDALATSPLLWTGLTDSQGREVYLAPFLARFNRDAMRRFYVLDYRGRMFIAPSDEQLTETAALSADPIVANAVRESRDGFGLSTSPQGRTQILMVQRIRNPNSEQAVGFLVARIDVPATLARLKVDADISLSLALGDFPLTPAPPKGLMFTAESRGMAGSEELRVPVHVWVAHPITTTVVASLAGLAVALMLGFWTMSRVRSWSQRFAATTTERLDRLLLECQQILAGQRLQAVAPGPDDELSEVTEALNAMLLKQKQFTDDLRTTALVFSTAAEGILVTDPQGRIVEANAALLAMTGYARHELLGEHAGTLYRSATDREFGRMLVAALLETGRWSGEATFMRRDQVQIPTSIAISRILSEDGEILGNVTVITDISRLKKVENQLRDLANQDALTGLPNFRHMSEQVTLALEDAQHRPRSLAAVFLDLDNFKAVNDEHGHDAGDTVIKAVAAHLQKNLPAGYLLCRRSGDEFIAVIERTTPDGRDVTSMLRRLTPLEVATDFGTLLVSTTIGVSRFPEDASDWRGLQICADVAMNEAKQAQRGSLVWYDDRIGRKLQRRRQIQGRLREALKDRALDVHYQPELDLRTGRVIGFEALARWHDAELGYVSPSEFVPVAEEAKMMDTLTLCIAEKVLRDKPKLRARFPGAVVAFNASPQVFQHSRLLEFLSEWSLRDEGAADGLEIELTETEISRTGAALQLQVQALVGLGVRLVIDDFGTGYSSLSRLTQFPISRIKIDRSFVEGLARTREQRIARLIVDLAKAMGFEVTAEGVETVEQRDSLLRMGCHRGQGWLFAKAMPADELLALEHPVHFPPFEGDEDVRAWPI